MVVSQDNHLELQPVPIPDCPGYGVTPDGGVWSRRDRWGERLRWKKLRAGLNVQNGYLYVTIHGLDKPTTRSVHSLIAETFIGPCPQGQEVRHKNGIRNDPSLTNLCYGTPVQNQQDKLLHGTQRAGSDIEHFVKLTEVEVLVIREKAKAGQSLSSLAREYHVTVGNIHAIVHRKSWKHI